MKKPVKLLLIAFLIITSLGILSCGNKSNGASPDTIKIASFNIQIFGQTKASKQEVMDILAQIIREFDIVAIQEIRDISGTAIIALKDEVNADGRAYDVLVGPRVGRTSSKEQYAYMYDTRTIEALSNSYTYDDVSDLFEREPFVAQFRVKSAKFEFVLINIHTKPDDALFWTVSAYPNDRPRPMTYPTLWYRIHTLGLRVKREGIIQAGHRDLTSPVRCTYATCLYRADMGIKAIQAKTHHVNIGTLVKHYIYEEEDASPYLTKLIS